MKLQSAELRTCGLVSLQMVLMLLQELNLTAKGISSFIRQEENTILLLIDIEEQLIP
jgi:hypothetical protein